MDDPTTRTRIVIAIETGTNAATRITARMGATTNQRQ